MYAIVASGEVPLDATTENVSVVAVEGAALALVSAPVLEFNEIQLGNVDPPATDQVVAGDPPVPAGE